MEKQTLLNSLDELVDRTTELSKDVLTSGKSPKGTSLNDYPYLGTIYISSLMILNSDDFKLSDSTHTCRIVHGLDLKNFLELNSLKLSSSISGMDIAPNEELTELEEFINVEGSRYNSTIGVVLPSPRSKDVQGEITKKVLKKSIIVVIPKTKEYSIICFPKDESNYSSSVSILKKKSWYKKVEDKLYNILMTKPKTIKLTFIGLIVLLNASFFVLPSLYHTIFMVSSILATILTLYIFNRVYVTKQGYKLENLSLDNLRQSIKNNYVIKTLNSKIFSYEPNTDTNDKL